MSSKTTIAVPRQVRNRVKKLAALLNKTQGDIVQLALKDFEKNLFRGLDSHPKKEIDMERVEKILKESTEKVWAADPEHKAIQLKLEASGDTIDDYLIRTWDPGFPLEDGIESSEK